MFKKIILVAFVLCVYCLAAISARPNVAKLPIDLVSGALGQAVSSGSAAVLTSGFGNIPVAGSVLSGGGAPALGGLPVVGKI